MKKMLLAINIINYLRDTKEPKVDNVKKTIFESSLDEDGKKDILMFLKDCLTTSDVPDYIEQADFAHDDDASNFNNSLLWHYDWVDEKKKVYNEKDLGPIYDYHVEIYDNETGIKYYYTLLLEKEVASHLIINSSNIFISHSTRVPFFGWPTCYFRVGFFVAFKEVN